MHYAVDALPLLHLLARGMQHLTHGWVSEAIAFKVLVSLGWLLIGRLARMMTRPGFFRRLWHGEWVYNANMRQKAKVIGRDKFGTVVESKDHIERRAEAIRERRERYRLFVAYLGLMIVTWLTFEQSREAGASFWLIPLVLCLAGWSFFMTFYVVAGLITEIFYVAGFAHMKGARVIVPPPEPPPGPEVLHNANSYGNAAAAGVGDIGAVYGGQRDGEPQTRFRN